ncbi:MAG: sulfiredoxin [Oscillatoria sp. PMC 1051.18]|nr:sulfiredoxin [Oscillatoria sp. PMC 1050.18]MEC5030522.1 sulfiredoxin [Oscillatoria sp. PMC 1051.18]
MVAIKEIPVAQIRRPLPRQTDPDKVQALMESIAAEGLREPIDVLEVDGEYYGFSGCHRYEAHQRLGKETIRCRVRHAPKSVLRMHLA